MRAFLHGQLSAGQLSHGQLSAGQQGELPIPAGSSILGRGQDCALRIDDPRLSRHHARLLNDGSTLVIEDIGSTNGVLVNGERIEGKKSLHSGDTIVCGPCVFIVALDPTQKARASELLPSIDRKPDLHKTEEMDPLNLPVSERVPASKPGRALNPLIAAALSSSSGEFSGNDVSSDVLRPNEVKDHTGALIHRGDTHPRGNSIIPPPLPLAKSTEEKNVNKKDKTSGLVPADFLPDDSGSDNEALQPDFVTPIVAGPASAAKRCFAGVADAVTLVVLIVIIDVPLLIMGYVWSLAQAGVVIENGLPQLTTTPNGSANWTEIMASLFHHGGVARAGDIIARLMRADDQQPFMTFFALLVLSVLFALVAVILHLISATVIRGAPFWHRRLGIEVVEARTGYFLTWGRAVARWIAFLVLWPLAPIALALDQRALHDLLTGCAVRKKRSEHR
jgi:hypothetical protein